MPARMPAMLTENVSACCTVPCRGPTVSHAACLPVSCHAGEPEPVIETVHEGYE